MTDKPRHFADAVDADGVVSVPCWKAPKRVAVPDVATTERESVTCPRCLNVLRRRDLRQLVDSRTQADPYYWHTMPRDWVHADRVHSAREERDRLRSGRPGEVLAGLLLYHVAEQNPDLADAVLVVTVVGGLDGLAAARAVTRLSGRQIVRLAWEFDEALDRAAVGELEDLCGPGGVLRAAMRAASGSEAMQRADEVIQLFTQQCKKEARR